MLRQNDVIPFDIIDHPPVQPCVHAAAADRTCKIYLHVLRSPLPYNNVYIQYIPSGTDSAIFLPWKVILYFTYHL